MAAACARDMPNARMLDSGGQSSTFNENLRLLALLDRQPILPSQKEMRLARNKAPFRRKRRSTCNTIKFSEYPRAFAFQTTLYFAKSFARRRKDNNVSGRLHVDA
jgi:hypothetical protein